MAIPVAPVRGYSFTGNSTNNPSSQQPGVQLDAEYDRTNTALGQLINAVSVSINADGTLNTTQVQTALTSLGISAGGTGGGGTNIADAPSQLYMQLAQDWAEYLPGPLPSDSLAQTGVTGSHYSARYWAIQAALWASGAHAPGAASPGALTNDGTGTLSWVQYLPLAGGTLTGPLTLAADPSANLQAATKQYADTKLSLAGGAMTGALTLFGTPTGNLHAATKNYVDTQDNTAANLAANTYLPMTGGTMSGFLTLNANPSTSLHAATKTYVDTADALKLNLAGGTLTGPLIAPSVRVPPQTVSAAKTLDNTTFGQTIELSGGPYTITLPSPVTYPGGSYRFFITAFNTNAFTLSTPAGTFANGSGIPATTTAVLHASQSSAFVVVSDGTNWLLTLETAPGTAAMANYKNKLQNGWMEIRQRGAGPFTVSGAYTADRWQVAATSGTISATCAAGAFGPCREYLSVGTTGTAAAGYVAVIQKMEAAEAFDLVAQTVTVSFWGSAANSGGAFQAQIQLYYPSAVDNFATTTLIASQNVTLTGVTGRVSATFTNLPANLGSGLLVQVALVATAAGNLTLNLSGLQLELGGFATALEKRPYSVENALCQRYYSTVQCYWAGYSLAGTSNIIGNAAPVTMRATPTATLQTNSTSNVGSVSVTANTGLAALTGVTTATGSVVLNGIVALSAEL